VDFVFFKDIQYDFLGIRSEMGLWAGCSEGNATSCLGFEIDIWGILI